MEPENHLFEEENHLPNLHDVWRVQNVNFQGCMQHTLPKINNSHLKIFVCNSAAPCLQIRQPFHDSVFGMRQIRRPFQGRRISRMPPTTTTTTTTTTTRLCPPPKKKTPRTQGSRTLTSRSTFRKHSSTCRGSVVKCFEEA